MRNAWWKIGTVALLLLVLIASWLTPLSPGILSISQDRATPGKLVLDITGYNTHFWDAQQSMKTWIQSGESVYCAEAVIYTDNTHLKARFNIPARVEKNLSHIIINNDQDGSFALMDGIWLDAPKGQSISSCTIEIANYEENYFSFPNKTILMESIRNLNFHVPMWFGMMLILLYSLINSVRALRTKNWKYDLRAKEAVHVALLLGLLGLITGSIWARFTWSAWWVNDAKLNGAAITTLIYLAYFVLRGSIQDEEKRARVAAVYSIFAYVMLILFLFILPRTTVSLHPGNGGNPAFSQYDLDNNMRMIFYPAVLGWALLAYWFVTLRVRLGTIERKVLYDE